MAHFMRELTKTFQPGLTPGLDIRTVNGNVKVHGEERTDVMVLATIRGRADIEEDIDHLVAEFDQTIRADGDRVLIHEPDQDRGSLFGIFGGGFRFRRHLAIDIDVLAPKGCSLSLHHVNGPVDLGKIGGDVSVHMVNGRFDLEDVGGDVSFHHVNGAGSVRNVAGSLEMHYTNGHLEIEHAAGDVKLHLVNGRVDIADAGGSVSVKGVSGAYTYRGPVRGDITMSNGHGRITLDLPDDSRFQLDARSAMGSVTSELDVRDGHGGAANVPRVSLRSETGRIELRRLRQAEPAGV